MKGKGIRMVSFVVYSLLFAVCPPVLIAAGSGEGNPPAVSSATKEASGRPEAEMIIPQRTESPWKIVERQGEQYLDDGFGEVIPFKDYRNIVITSAGLVEIMYLLETEDRIAAVGASLTQIWPEEKTARLPDVGNLARPSLEKILSVEPDLVILNAMNTDLAENLKNLKVPTIIHAADTISEILDSVLIMGKITGTTKKADKIAEHHRQTLDKIQLSLKEKPLGLKGAFVYSANPMMAFREDSLPGEILSFFGIVNIAKGLPTERPILSPEYLLEQNPDFILGAMSIQEKEDILNANRMVRKTRAGREGNIFILPSQMFLRPSPKILEKLPGLYEQLSSLAEP